MSTTMPHPVGANPSTSEIEVVASDCVEEIDEALSIVHDGFVEAGYMAPQPSGRRMHASYLNPGTVFFVARIDGRPVGTCALIADGPFGLPSDRAFAEENDQMRATHPGVMRECGSLAVRSEERRHTRRIVVRTIAAMTRVTISDFPDAPIAMAVTPQNERFYSAIVDAVPVAGERPLYGPPAVLLRTSGHRIAAHCTARGTPLARMMDDLVNEDAPSWFDRRRATRPLPAGWLQDLIDEQGITDRLSAQLALLAEHHPRVLSRTVGWTSPTVAA